ncbi:spore protease YyaC [Paenibacillus agricola]|uniref:Spore protease YyaC n=1 Tax=Paenibacillus agricola TaxID=2716264 RepID=A0ABX0IZU7_9BACL|nr:spore protease YyaC [Paenibacillus agricola]NHN29510.1 spore protease YyaC [Paenibacillus agricola]
MLHHIHYLDKKSAAFLSEALVKHFSHQPAYTEIVVVCIGTNRYPGDSLGPMVGSRLFERLEGSRYVHIYGTLDKPVHALNMQRTLAYIANRHRRAYIIAVDACLGQFYKIGTLQLVDEPLQPGASLSKELSSIGHIHIKGIINNHGPLNHKVLEHTSLTFVNEMAAVISRIIVKSSQEIIPRLLSIKHAESHVSS